MTYRSLGTGTIFASETLNNEQVPLNKIAYGSSGVTTLVSSSLPLPVSAALGLSTAIIGSLAASTAIIGSLGLSTAIVGYTLGGGGEVQTQINKRPATTLTYAANSALSNSTSAGTITPFGTIVPSAGKSCVITDCKIVSSDAPTTPLQGEIYIFNSPPTALNDGSSFIVSAADMLKCEGKIPFTLALDTGSCSWAFITGVGMTVTPSTGTQLYPLTKVLNAYATPGSSATLTVELGYQPLTA